MKLTANFLENLELADVVRGSHEDFDVMFRTTDTDTVYRSQISFYCRKFICTRGSAPLDLRAEGGLRKQYPVADVQQAVSTIGAGDNFNAGFIYGIMKYGITRSMMEDGLSEAQWDALIATAQAFSAECCRSINNSVSAEFGSRMHAEMEAYINNQQE